MTLTELKKSIHEKIDNSNDLELLKMVNAIVNTQDEVFVIPEHMRKGVRQGIEDIKNGNTHSMEDFKTKYQQWLK